MADHQVHRLPPGRHPSGASAPTSEACSRPAPTAGTHAARLPALAAALLAGGAATSGLHRPLWQCSPLARLRLPEESRAAWQRRPLPRRRLHREWQVAQQPHLAGLLGPMGLRIAGRRRIQCCTAGFRRDCRSLSSGGNIWRVVLEPMRSGLRVAGRQDLQVSAGVFGGTCRSSRSILRVPRGAMRRELRIAAICQRGFFARVCHLPPNQERLPKETTNVPGPPFFSHPNPPHFD